MPLSILAPGGMTPCFHRHGCAHPGEFAAQALLHLPAPSYVDVGITGGSGDYRNARGFVRTVPAGDTERHLTVHLKR
ncbi:hypothetical protein [Streptomyces sp. NPDC057909]|uniref:hypothetical protein n=1 Tax=Streptomyces sp. NPDC057909 TaxID=3346277 RepID=UPI0036E8DD86